MPLSAGRKLELITCHKIEEGRVCESAGLREAGNFEAASSSHWFSKISALLARTTKILGITFLVWVYHKKPTKNVIDFSDQGKKRLKVCKA